MDFIKSWWQLFLFAFLLGIVVAFCSQNAHGSPFSGELSLQTFQGDNPFLNASGDVKYVIPKTHFSLVGGVLYGMYGLDTYSSTSDWAYSVGTTYDLGKHLTFNADYIYKTYDNGFQVYELTNSPSTVRVGMTLHF